MKRSNLVCQLRILEVASTPDGLMFKEISEWIQEARLDIMKLTWDSN